MTCETATAAFPGDFASARAAALAFATEAERLVDVELADHARQRLAARAARLVELAARRLAAVERRAQAAVRRQEQRRLRRNKLQRKRRAAARHASNLNPSHLNRKRDPDEDTG